MPTDSTDARELREVEAEHLARVGAGLPHNPACQAGWIGEDADGKPTACPRCHPATRATACSACLCRASTCLNRQLLHARLCCAGCTHGRRVSS